MTESFKVSLFLAVGNLQFCEKSSDISIHSDKSLPKNHAFLRVKLGRFVIPFLATRTLPPQ